MAQIAEHHSEQEGEGDTGVQCGIALPVGGHTVSINQVLEATGEFVRPVEGRWLLIGIDHVQERGNGAAHGGGSVRQSLLDNRQILGWHPAFADQALLGHVHVEQIKRVVDGLHFLDHDRPRRQVLRHGGQNTATVILSLAENQLQIFQAGADVAHHLLALVVRAGARV